MCSSVRSVVASADEFVVNDGLDTGFSASDVVAHGVETSLGGVHFDDAFESSLAASELVLIELALGFAFLEEKSLGVLAILEHLAHVDLGVQVWVQSWFIDSPTWCKPSGNSSAHLFSGIYNY